MTVPTLKIMRDITDKLKVAHDLRRQQDGDEILVTSEMTAAMDRVITRLARADKGER